jgi:hypothetical protein
MNFAKLVGVLLIALGVLGFVYGDFSFTKATHDAKLGPIEFSVKEKQTVEVPVWASSLAVIAGVALLLLGGSKR